MSTDPSEDVVSSPVRRTRRWERGGVDRVPQFVENWGAGAFVFSSGVLLAAAAVLSALWYPWGLGALAPVLLFVALGTSDVFQKQHAVRRNFPVLGRMRYLLESLRPEIRQYFVESDQEPTPFSREQRSLIYQRAKAVVDSAPFGTKRNVNGVGYEWLAQSLEPEKVAPDKARVLIGSGESSKPYSASLFNISAMSYGSLSKQAVLALNAGAQRGQFFHNTGEGGVSPYHRQPGGDLVWQIGTGYFGCRTKDGKFDPGLFEQTAGSEQVKMVEVKLSQGAKPAHGGLLPGDKVTAEVAEIRGVEVGKTVHSPSRHSAFSGPSGLLHWLASLRELSGGKPTGFKLCVGQPVEVFALVKAMLATGIAPDFITVDGAEGGTGAAPLEFSNSVGMPLTEGLFLMHNALLGAGLRGRVRLISAGKIASGFDLVRQLALGADLCNSARGMMFALGCIQALKCNTNKCPVGVATQNEKLGRGLVVPVKADRVHSFHAKTVLSALDLIGAAGLTGPEQLRPEHVFRRISSTAISNLGEIYRTLDSGALLREPVAERFRADWARASSDHFSSAAHGLKPMVS